MSRKATNRPNICTYRRHSRFKALKYEGSHFYEHLHLWHLVFDEHAGAVSVSHQKPQYTTIAQAAQEEGDGDEKSSRRGAELKQGLRYSGSVQVFLTLTLAMTFGKKVSGGLRSWTLIENRLLFTRCCCPCYSKIWVVETVVEALYAPRADKVK